MKVMKVLVTVLISFGIQTMANADTAGIKVFHGIKSASDVAQILNENLITIEKPSEIRSILNGAYTYLLVQEPKCLSDIMKSDIALSHLLTGEKLASVTLGIQELSSKQQKVLRVFLSFPSEGQAIFCELKSEFR